MHSNAADKITCLYVCICRAHQGVEIRRFAQLLVKIRRSCQFYSAVPSRNCQNFVFRNEFSSNSVAPQTLTTPTYMFVYVYAQSVFCHTCITTPYLPLSAAIYAVLCTDKMMVNSRRRNRLVNTCCNVFGCLFIKKI